ncbi:MAG TPA: S41 family peptidase, partial [Cellvibrio sp.]
IKSKTQYVPPSVSEPTPDKLWIRASDFALHTPEAAQSQQKLLDDLALIKEVNLIVLDTRGNAGGSSTHGINIFNTIINKDEKAATYLANQFHFKNQGATALFRASWQLYWSYDYALKTLIANQGKEFSDAQYLEKFQVRLKQALETGEQTLYQSETPDESNAIPPPNDEWESNIKIVLITDRTCVSACLDFVDMVKLVPNLLHLGEPTNADTAYTQIADMQSKYLEETYNFMVPVKKWNKRLRDDNNPYIPDVVYEGDMNDDATLQQWVLAQAEQHFNQR